MRETPRKPKLEERLDGSTSLLHDMLEKQLAQIPQLLLEQLVAEKLEAQEVKLDSKELAELAAQLLKGSIQHFALGKGNERLVKLALDSADLDELLQRGNRFNTEKLPKLLPTLAVEIAAILLASLRKTWPEESTQQSQDLALFRLRMEGRWGTPLEKLRMLICLVREWSESTWTRWAGDRSSKAKFGKLRTRLLIRGCQVGDEILCLLENGFADGAMARWRTLHEIAVVATLIVANGDEIAQKYIDHQHIESKRALDKYVLSAPLLGFRPLSKKAQARIQAAYEQMIQKHGKDFASDYGWAGSALGISRPTFTQLEKAAGHSQMRSHYQMGNDNIHAGIKSMYVRLGLLENYAAVLAGRSNAGLTDPGQNMAVTLAGLAMQVCLIEAGFDDLVIAEMIVTLRDEIPRSFARVDKHLRQEESKRRSAGGL